MQFQNRPIEWMTSGLFALVIFGLTLPQINLARESSRQLQCHGSLSQLGRAISEFESAYRGNPPRRTGFNDGNPYGGWGNAIHPYLASPVNSATYDPQFDFFDPKNREVVESVLPVFLCAASPAGRRVEIQSQASTKSSNKDKDTVFTCQAAASDFITSNGVLMTRNGYGINALPGESRLGNQRQAMTDNTVLPVSKITDGRGTTLLLIEQAGRPAVWRNGEIKEGAGQFGLSPNARGAWAGWGSIAFGAANASNGETPGKGDESDCSVNCNNWFGIYGFHETGGSVLFCDGSVRTMSTHLDPLTFAYLTIRDDGHIINEGDY